VRHVDYLSRARAPRAAHFEEEQPQGPSRASDEPLAPRRIVPPPSLVESEYDSGHAPRREAPGPHRDTRGRAEGHDMATHGAPFAAKYGDGLRFI